MASNQRRRTMRVYRNEGGSIVFAAPFSDVEVNLLARGFVRQSEDVRLNESSIPPSTVQFAATQYANGEPVRGRVHSDGPQPWIPLRLGVLPVPESATDRCVDVLLLLTMPQPTLPTWPTPAREAGCYWFASRTFTICVHDGDRVVTPFAWAPWPALPVGVVLA